MSLLATVVDISTTLSSTSLAAGPIHTSITDEMVSQSEQWTVALKALFGLGLTIFAAILMIGSRGKFGKILMGLVSLGVAGWIVLGTGASWFATEVDEQFNGAPAVVAVVPPFDEV